MISLKLLVRDDHLGQANDRILADLLSQELGRKVGRTWARELLRRGRVRCGGEPVGLHSAGQPAVWELRISPTEAAPGAPVLSFDALRATLFRDEHWLVIDKPSGLLVHPGVDKQLLDLVSALSPSLEGLPWTLQHRLDRETSGLVLFTLSVPARLQAARQFEERKVEKGYLCRVGPLPPKHPQAWVESSPLLERRGRVACHPEGKAAQTSFRVVQADSRGTLLEATPKTGRKHQIRVHLATRGLPILGDELYGGRPGGRLLLHASWLSLQHPDGSSRRLEAPLPADFKAF